MRVDRTLTRKWKEDVLTTLSVITFEFRGGAGFPGDCHGGDAVCESAGVATNESRGGRSFNGSRTVASEHAFYGGDKLEGETQRMRLKREKHTGTVLGWEKKGGGATRGAREARLTTGDTKSIRFSHVRKEHNTMWNPTNSKGQICIREA